MKVLYGFEYRRGVSVIHRIDPRSKMIYVILFTALTVYFVNPLLLLLVLSSSLPIVAISRIGSRWSQSIKGSLFFIAFIFIFNFIGIVWATGSVYDAVISGISMSIRFIALISIFSVFFLTTSPEDLTQSMVQVRIPYDYALTFNMAMRFVPTLSREAQIIMDAQKSRGLEMEKGNLIRRIKNYIPVLIPLIISSFRRAELVADAMESRAFGASKKRTSLYVLALGKRDALFILITVLSFLLLLSLRLVLGIQ
ncbi:MAG: energy-coupling factor transporter transmembrane protein EcfT [Candidatus Verstraetearchaeota archaeon]|nr:energy-coupling factor transporter transmembrane protein EcfT [Candidatus Verstraetearchaeota archaeon]